MRTSRSLAVPFAMLVLAAAVPVAVAADKAPVSGFYGGVSMRDSGTEQGLTFGNVAPSLMLVAPLEAEPRRGQALAAIASATIWRSGERGQHDRVPPQRSRRRGLKPPVTHSGRRAAVERRRRRRMVVLGHAFAVRAPRLCAGGLEPVYRTSIADRSAHRRRPAVRRGARYDFRVRSASGALRVGIRQASRSAICSRMPSACSSASSSASDSAARRAAASPVRDSPPVVVRLVFLARLREAFGNAGETLQLPATAPATVAAVLDALRARGGAFADELAPGSSARGREPRDGEAGDAVRDGDEIALFPPVTGG
jgi:molybdopterin synthase sulfur carrier subunit